MGDATGMTVTLDTPRVERISRSLSMLTGSIAFDTSYPTGGEADTPITKYFDNCLMIAIESDAGYVFKWDKATSKVLAYWVDTTTDGAPMVQVTDDTDIVAAAAARFIAIGFRR